jgi:hypothetical protein
VTRVPSAGWRVVYRWCGVSSELDQEGVGQLADRVDVELSEAE